MIEASCAPYVDSITREAPTQIHASRSPAVHLSASCFYALFHESHPVRPEPSVELNQVGEELCAAHELAEPRNVSG